MTKKKVELRDYIETLTRSYEHLNSSFYLKTLYEEKKNKKQIKE